jgi:hypothetical protein
VFGLRECSLQVTKTTYSGLKEHSIPVDDEAHLLFSCSATAVVRRERRFAQLPFSSLQDRVCCRDVYGVALFVLPGNNLDEVES